MTKLSFETKEGDLNDIYRVTLESINRIHIERFAPLIDNGKWIHLGSGYWSGKHIVYCSAKLEAFEYKFLDEMIKKELAALNK